MFVIRLDPMAVRLLYSYMYVLAKLAHSNVKKNVRNKATGLRYSSK